jgi:hypothetical protein
MSAPDAPAAESIDGTRTSHRWNDLPGSFDTVNARRIYSSANEYGIPDLPPATVIPAQLVSYSDRYACETAKPGTAVHTFLDDYRFEICWSKPQRPLSRLQRAGLALTPDFSLYTGMPAAMQLWQVYRSRWCGRWWTEHGISVIPTVSWSTPDSYRYAFAGLPACSVVAVSAVGVLRDRDALKLFEQGYWAMAETIRPTAVLCYGRLPAGCHLDIPAYEYPTRWNERKG